MSKGARRLAGLAVVFTLALGAAPAAEARTAVTRIAPYDFGCVNWYLCGVAPWEPARQGHLTPSAGAVILWAYAFPIPLVFASSTVAGIRVPIDRPATFDVSVRIRQISVGGDLAGGGVGGRFCISMGSPGGTTGECFQLPVTGETVVRLPPSSRLEPGVGELRMYLMPTGTAVIDRVHYVLAG